MRQDYMPGKHFQKVKSRLSLYSFIISKLTTVEQI